jgi:hypothetical protein
MALDGTYETKLLRLLIGHFHVSQMEMRAMTRFDNKLHKLTLEQRQTLEDELVADVVRIAESISEEKLKATPVAPSWMN